MPLINCKIELILTWSRNSVIISANINNQVPTFTITETNLYVPVVTLSTQDDAQRTSNRRYYIPNVVIKDYNVMIDGKIFLINQ